MTNIFAWLRRWWSGAAVPVERPSLESVLAAALRAGYEREARAKEAEGVQDE